jgi:signal recognition particle subunit SRP54
MISSMSLDERRNPERFIETSWEQVVQGGQVKGRRRVAHYCEPRIRRVARGSGRKEAEVMELLHKFALMRQMMLTMGAQAGLLGKIPGLRTISKIKQFAGMDLGAIMNAAGMQSVEPRHSAPRPNTDKMRDKRKRKLQKEARRKNKKK